MIRRPRPYTQTPGLAAGLALALVGGLAPALAQPATAPVTPDVSGWSCRFCPFESGSGGFLELGAAHASDGASRYGDFTGYGRAGGYLLGLAEFRQRSDSIDLDFTATDLGVDGRSLVLRGGQQGLYGFHAAWHGSPKYWGDGARTPFERPGNNELALPTGWTTAGSTADMDTLDASLRPFRVQLDRRRIDLGAAFRQDSGPAYRIDYSRVQRSGTQVMGGTFLTNASLLPKPVDDVTEQVEFGVALEKPGWQWRGVYQGSYYRNANDFLAWQNPYDPLSAGADRGQMALAPDNQAHQLSSALALQPLPGTTVSVQLAAGRLLQSERLAPVTVNPDLAQPLARDDSGGRVETLNGTVRSGTRLTPSLRLELEYRYRDRNNRTPEASYPQVQTDVYVANPRVNRPYDFTDQIFKASLSQRLPAGVRVAAGYEGKVARRELLAVDRTRDDTVWGRLRLQPTDRSDLELRLALGDRDGPTPRSLDSIAPPENPRQRQYNLADRDRRTATARWTFLWDPNWSYGTSVGYSSDRYTGTEIGLREGQEFHVDADLAWRPTPDRALTAWVGHGQVRTEQAGSRAFSIPDWWAENTDDTDSLTLNLEERNVLGGLDLVASYTFVQSRGRTVLNDGGQWRPFPETDSRLQGLGLRGQYRLRPALSLALGLRHERFDQADWRIDGIVPATVPNLLATGLGDPDYRVTVVFLSLRWQLGGPPPDDDTD